MNQTPVLSFAGVEPQELGIEHQVDVDPHSGQAAIRVPLRLSEGRNGFGPRLALEYDSAGANTPYGVGWSLSGLLTISISSRDGLPRYAGGDRYDFSGNELVPALRKTAGGWEPVVVDRGDWRAYRYRSRVERNHIRVERWVHKQSGHVHWRTHDAADVQTIYGLDPSGASRVADPADPGRVFVWLPEAQFDPYGNAIVFRYAKEDRQGVDTTTAFEHSRVDNPAAQRYLKRVLWGNVTPLGPDQAIPANATWHFEAVFDYGDHGNDDPTPNRQWAVRPDPFSTYRPGFEVRTWRLCRRVLQFHRFAELGQDPRLVGEHRLGHDLRPDGSVLTAIGYTGVRRDQGQERRKSFPELRFTYSAPVIGSGFEPAPVATGENLPAGFGEPSYRLVDLYGEGIPGSWPTAATPGTSSPTRGAGPSAPSSWWSSGRRSG